MSLAANFYLHWVRLSNTVLCCSFWGCQHSFKVSLRNLKKSKKLLFHISFLCTTYIFVFYLDWDITFLFTFGLPAILTALPRVTVNFSITLLVLFSYSKTGFLNFNFEFPYFYLIKFNYRYPCGRVFTMSKYQVHLDKPFPQ